MGLTFLKAKLFVKSSFSFHTNSTACWNWNKSSLPNRMWKYQLQSRGNSCTEA